MLKKITFVSGVVLIFGAICFGQNDIQIKKKTSFKIPGMPAMPGMADLENRPSTVSLKGSRMRTDSQMKTRNKFGKKENLTSTMILQCDKQRRVQFNSKSKKYFTDTLSGNSSDAVKNAKTGGTVLMTGSVTDTGERAKLFGYDARRLKQTYTLTPGKNSCVKEKLTIEVDGWYADLPEFSCPVKRDPSEFQMDGNCFDEVDYQVKGAVTGVALKEIKTLMISGMKMNIEEEVVELKKVSLTDDLFEPPTNYKAANTFKEVQEDDGADDDAAATNEPLPIVPSNDSTLAPPKAGLEKTPLGAKRSGVIRIGILKPQVKLSDKDSADGASEVGDAIVEVLTSILKTETVESVELASPTEAKTLECDYVFTANVTQKKGGGLLGKFMPPMPGKGGMTNPNRETFTRLQALMFGYVKAKDEWTFEYKLTGANGTAALQNSSKVKAEQYGEDVLTKPIKDAANAVSGKFSK